MWEAGTPVLTGIIPARAGFTLSSSPRPGGGGDHPRSRGVYAAAYGDGGGRSGSSPLARGLRAAQAARAPGPGIIPARAGFTRPGTHPHAHAPDHPRSRGVYASHTMDDDRVWGSSPLARGLPGPWSPIRSRRRIIPARAGFTRPRARPAGLPGDHPRSRGVYPAAAPPAGSVQGSSPLARGLPGWVTMVPIAARIIPARAGFTSTPPSIPLPRPDHPRSRGVYHHARLRLAVTIGSSPLARGLRPRASSSASTCGIIPARAGFTGHAVQRVHGVPDHPRSRGVYPGPEAVTAPGTGSSPLARGLQ